MRIAALEAALVAVEKDRDTQRFRVVELEKERDERMAEINRRAARETAEVNEAITDLQRICADPEEAHRYFVIAEMSEIEENEYNLNLPRYVDTFASDSAPPLAESFASFVAASAVAKAASAKILNLIPKE